MDSLMQNKVCVVTGGTGTIGLAAVDVLLREGATIAIFDQQPLAEGCFNDDRVLFLTVDVTAEDAIAAAIETVVQKLGKIDLLFCNAGYFGEVAPIQEYPTDIFDRTFAVNVRGAFLLCKYGVPQMNDGGSIVINSSVSGLRGDSGVFGYSVAKHAQVGLMRCLAKELAGRAIRVNTIHPGPIDNSFQQSVEDRFSAFAGFDATAYMNQVIPLGRHGTVEEVANAVLYLASPLSSFTTGATIALDGGLSL